MHQQVVQGSFGGIRWLPEDSVQFKKFHLMVHFPESVKLHRLPKKQLHQTQWESAVLTQSTITIQETVLTESEVRPSRNYTRSVCINFLRVQCNTTWRACEVDYYHPIPLCDANWGSAEDCGIFSLWSSPQTSIWWCHAVQRESQLSLSRVLHVRRDLLPLSTCTTTRIQSILRPSHWAVSDCRKPLHQEVHTTDARHHKWEHFLCIWSHHVTDLNNLWHLILSKIKITFTFPKPGRIKKVQ